ncbi:PHP domain-containing protein [Aldersonia sp. NBC_00410]|uniref:PHP domain-containing protein n=1 Tax=Aldersonia sp. NBC_00410 TaxID=2975954 RepID=UPI00225255B5|nr:PHP domain-containing protein [Aldersonia sp. NBC_00410]MCX5041681.1 PHP domain-containing protein [Aldersonia sp. NBC_00410]
MTRHLRLASHIHSSWSDDCDWPLPKLARTLRRVGFDGALICDHDRTMTEDRRRRLVEECAAVGAGGFLMVPGIEYQDPDHVVHIPVFGDVPFLGRSLPVLDILKEGHSAGAVTVFAHPARAHAHARFDERWVPHLTGIEVWNRKYDGVAPNEWAARTAKQFGLGPFVGLDFHGPRQLFPLSVTVESDRTDDWTAVIDALHAGSYRATALGTSAMSVADGPVGAGLRRAERARRAMAPRIRQLESKIRRRPAATAPTGDCR